MFIVEYELKQIVSYKYIESYLYAILIEHAEKKLFITTAVLSSKIVSDFCFLLCVILGILLLCIA